MTIDEEIDSADCDHDLSLSGTDVEDVWGCDACGSMVRVICRSILSGPSRIVRCERMIISDPLAVADIEAIDRQTRY